MTHAGLVMSDESDIRRQLLEMMESLTSDQLAELNDAVLDALVSSARGEPAHYAINECVHISQGEARRICHKIGLDWDTGKMEPENE